jgi:hypothetical protein
LLYIDNGEQVYLTEENSSITILASDMNNLIYFTDDILQPSHDISFRVIDRDNNGNLWVSNSATLTMDKTVANITGNQPAVVGDLSIKVNNQVTTTLTLAMFTTDLNPPYNDPENDLIDAIRIDEISTDNKGQFLYNSSPLVTGQIITREELDAGLFVHVGPNSTDIETDAFNFSVRDEGSGIWVK